MGNEIDIIEELIELTKEDFANFAIQSLLLKHDGLVAKIDELKKAGVFNGYPTMKIHTKTKAQYMVLVSKQVDGKRVRKYIGNKADKQEEARAKIARYAEMVGAENELSRTRRNAEGAVRSLAQFYEYCEE